MSTQKQISEHLDLDQAAVSRLMAELQIDWRKAPLEQVRIAYIRKLRAVAAGHQSSDGLDLTRERALTERVTRELAELTLAEKRGRVVDVALLEAELQQMVVAFRTDLIGRDDVLKADLDALYGTDIDLQILNDATRATLTQLARYDPERPGIGAPAGGPDGAAAAHDDDGVGEAAPAPVGQSVGPAGPLQP